MKLKKKAPCQARSFQQACRLQRTHYDLNDSAWLLTDGETVTITKQMVGESPTEKIHLTVAEFNRLVRWWQRGQKVGPKSAQENRHVRPMQQLPRTRRHDVHSSQRPRRILPMQGREPRRINHVRRVEV